MGKKAITDIHNARETTKYNSNYTDDIYKTDLKTLEGE